VIDLLVERDVELELLHEVVTGVAAGRSAFVEVTGPPGFGHTALLRRAMSLALSKGIRVLHATGTAGSDFGNDVMGHFATALGLDTTEWTSLSAVVLCENFLAAARKRPLMLVLDDAQWMDEQSREWLRAMLRRLAWAPLLVVVATSGLGTATESMTMEMATEATVNESTRHLLRLRPLTSEGVRELLGAGYEGTIDEEFVAALALHTRGTPSVVRAVLRVLDSGGTVARTTELSELIAGVTEARGDWVTGVMRVLPPAPAALVRVAAVCGDDFEWQLMCELAQLQPAVATRAAEVLRRLGITDGTQVRLSDPIVVERVLAEMTPQERLDLHRKVFTLGVRAGVGQSSLARVLLGAPVGVPGAAWLLHDEARRLKTEGRPEAAARLLERALREPEHEADRTGLMIELADTEAAYSPEASDRRLARMLLDPDTSDPAVRVRAADMLVSRGRPTMAQRAIMVAAGLPEVAEPERAKLVALYRMAEDTAPGGSVDNAAGLPPMAGMPTDPATAAVAAWLVAVRGQDRPRAQALARAGLAVPSRYDGPLSPRIIACSVLLVTGDVDEGKASLDAVLIEARRQGMRAAAVWGLLSRASMSVYEERWDEVCYYLDQMKRELPERCWHPMAFGHVRALTVTMYLRRGMPDEARRCALEPLPVGAEHSIGWAQALFARGLVRLVDGEPADALTHFLECGRRMLARQWTNPVLLSWRILAAIASAASGRPADAERLALEECTLAETWGAPGYLAMVRDMAAGLLERP
jgi:AAA ATPase-like protein